MIEIILLVVVLLLVVSVIALFVYVKSLDTATREFVIQKINELVIKINQSKLYEFNYNKQKDEYVKQLDQQVRTVSSLMNSES
jgi:hypothetical protein